MGRKQQEYMSPLAFCGLAQGLSYGDSKACCGATASSHKRLPNRFLDFFEGNCIRPLMCTEK